MSEVFGAAYSAAYDALYGGKAYEFECDMIEKAFTEFGLAPITRVLDLGCGTGGHAIPLARRGYEVIGVDRSQGMLDAARPKVESAGVANRVTLVAGEITSVPAVARCDAALMMFAVLGYLATNTEVEMALASTRRNLRDGALLVFDVWHAPAVLRYPPGQRWKIVDRAGSSTLRLSAGELDTQARTCTVSFRVMEIAGGRVTHDTEEKHAMRYFDRDELERLLACAGFELLRLGGFPDYSREPAANDWSISVIARAV
jgi:SAM-dependent methyltransferase